MNTLTLSGKSDAKGRNGYYKLAKVDIWTAIDEIVYIDFMSKRGGPSARLMLTQEDYKKLKTFITELREMPA